MSFKDILVHVDSTPASRARLKLALALSKCFAARLTGLHVIPEPVVPPYFKPSAVERIAEIYGENAREAADWAKRLFDEEVAEATVPTAWEYSAGDLEDCVAERARFADLLVLGQFDSENPPGIYAFLLPAKIVFGVAGPILVVPNLQAAGDIGRRVVAAWDGSREAARAIRDALPLLKRAAEVLLLSDDLARQGHLHDDDGASQFAAHLRRHGISVTVAETASGKRHSADVLLTQAAEFGADLLVMGAYGHPRVWEFAVGGTTQDLLERTTIPVLISR
jgi:nucleotide-binding universal stress UspA family protein